MDYYLADHEVAQKWIKKIKHLQKVEFDPYETDEYGRSYDLDGAYKEFCECLNISPIEKNKDHQQYLNDLHELFECNHDSFPKEKRSILYKFHYSVHYSQENYINDYFGIGWGVKEGPLTEKIRCYSQYTDSIEQGNLYLEWNELGKRPYRYWKEKEPNDKKRFNELCIPHINLRARFSIPYRSMSPKTFSPEFINWFDEYKADWLNMHHLQDWTPLHEFGSVPVGEPVTPYVFQDLIAEYKTVHKIQLMSL